MLFIGYRHLSYNLRCYYCRYQYHMHESCSVGCQMCLRLLAHSVRINHVLSCHTNGAPPPTHTQAHDHNVFHDIPYDKLTSTAEYMYRQVHATSLPVNILHITCLTSCTQWLQEATPFTPLPLAKDYTGNDWWLNGELTSTEGAWLGVHECHVTGTTSTVNDRETNVQYVCLQWGHRHTAVGQEKGVSNTPHYKCHITQLGWQLLRSMVCLYVLSLGPRAVSDRTMKGIFRTVCSKDRNCGAREWIRTHVQVETQMCPIHKSTNIPYLRLLLYDVMCAFNLNNTQSWQWSCNTHAVVHQSLAWHALCMCYQCGSSIYYATECLQVKYVASTQYMEQSNTDIPTRGIGHTSNEWLYSMYDM